MRSRGRDSSSALGVIHGTVVICLDLSVRARQIKPGPASRIAIGRVGIGGASVVMALGRSIFGTWERLGSFDDGGDEASFNMPFDVAVQQPHTRVVGAEAKHSMAMVLDHDCVTADGRLRDIWVVCSSKVATVNGRALQDLELVAV